MKSIKITTVAKICIFTITVTKLYTQTAMIDLYLQVFAKSPLKDSRLKHRTWFSLKHHRLCLICAQSRNSRQLGYHANWVLHSIIKTGETEIKIAKYTKL